jgi:uncharacterized protein
MLVPGLNDSGPEHWQSIWQRRHAFWMRVTHSRWDIPDLGRWTSALRRQLSGVGRPTFLVGHSFGALASIAFALDPSRDAPLAGLMLVAPAEPRRFEVEEAIPARPLGVPAVVVASHNDPVMTFARAVHWSEAWNAELVDVGEAGHINAEAGFGAWPYGLDVLARLVSRSDIPGA